MDTLFIIKPDAVARNAIGAIIGIVEAAGFVVVAQKMVSIPLATAERFYAEHSARPFFGELTEFMSSGPSVVCVLRRDQAVSKLREVLGDTNPANAAAGTIRKLYGASIGSNAAHASDSESSAAREVSFFFSAHEIVA